MTERLHFHFSLSCIGEGNSNLLQCSCVENPRDGGALWAAIYGVAQSRTRLKWLSSSSSSSACRYPSIWYISEDLSPQEYRNISAALPTMAIQLYSAWLTHCYFIWFLNIFFFLIIKADVQCMFSRPQRGCFNYVIYKPAWLSYT